MFEERMPDTRFGEELVEDEVPVSLAVLCPPGVIPDEMTCLIERPLGPFVEESPTPPGSVPEGYAS